MFTKAFGRIASSLKMKISIVTICFNSVDTISDAITSVLSQTYMDVEYIIIDGGSTDGTLEKIYSGCSSADNVIVLSEPDRGIYDAMNKGVALATGDVIGILNSDDFFKNNGILDEVSKRFLERPSLHGLFGGVEFVSPDNLSKTVRAYSSVRFKAWMMRFGFMPPHPGAFLKKSVYENIGYYQTNYRIAADFELLVRAFLVAKIDYKLTDDVFVVMRTGGASTSGLSSNIVSTFEMAKGLSSNSVFSSVFLLLLRLPVKYICQILMKR